MSTHPPATHILLPHTTWAASIFWWKVFFLKSFQKIVRLGADPPVPVPLKGPQQWKFPPPLKWIRNCPPSQWNDEETGYVMTVLSPPPTSKGDDKTSKRAILYFHGSGFQSPITPFHWGYCAYLAESLDAEVVVVPYPLCPGNPAQETMPVLLTVYSQFVKRYAGHELIVAGDSAGATVALCLMSSALSESLPLPSTILAICPGSDLAMTNPEMKVVARYDNMLTPEYCVRAARLWAGLSNPPSNVPAEPLTSEHLSNHLINPFAIDFSRFAAHNTKFIIVSGQWDVLHCDTVLLVKKAEEAGIGDKVTWLEGEHQFHVFPVAYEMVPECKQAAETINHLICSA